MHQKKNGVTTGNNQISYKIMIGVVLMLINDESQ